MYCQSGESLPEALGRSCRDVEYCSARGAVGVHSDIRIPRKDILQSRVVLTGGRKLPNRITLPQHGPLGA